METNFIQMKYPNSDYLLNCRNGSDTWVFKEITEFNDYQLDFTHWDKKTFDTVVDIGGHIGTFSIFMVPYTTRIIAFEPVKENIKLFRENISMNNIDSIILQEVGVSDHSGTATLNIGISYARTSLKNTKFCHSLRSEEILLIDIKTIVKEYNIKNTSLLKIDIEGNEPKLITELHDSDLQKFKLICLELHFSEEENYQDPYYNKMIDKLVKNNYKITVIDKFKKEGLETKQLTAIKE